MSLLKSNEKSTKYHMAGYADLWGLRNATDEQLEKWATDPDCIERHQCAVYLAERQRATAKRQEERRIAKTAKGEELQDNPFDPRTEVSADARHVAGRIVKHLWIIFVALPFVLAILFAILKSI